MKKNALEIAKPEQEIQSNSRKLLTSKKSLKSIAPQDFSDVALEMLTNKQPADFTLFFKKSKKSTSKLTSRKSLKSIANADIERANIKTATSTLTNE